MSEDIYICSSNNLATSYRWVEGRRVKQRYCRKLLMRIKINICESCIDWKKVETT